MHPSGKVLRPCSVLNHKILPCRIVKAVFKVINEGSLEDKTADIGGYGGTTAFTNAVVANLWGLTFSGELNLQRSPMPRDQELRWDGWQDVNIWQCTWFCIALQWQQIIEGLWADWAIVGYHIGQSWFNNTAAIMRLRWRCARKSDFPNVENSLSKLFSSEESQMIEAKSHTGLRTLRAFFQTTLTRFHRKCRGVIATPLDVGESCQSQA